MISAGYNVHDILKYIVLFVVVVLAKCLSAERSNNRVWVCATYIVVCNSAEFALSFQYMLIAKTPGILILSPV